MSSLPSSNDPATPPPSMPGQPIADSKRSSVVTSPPLGGYDRQSMVLRYDQPLPSVPNTGDRSISLPVPGRSTRRPSVDIVPPTSKTTRPVQGRAANSKDSDYSLSVYAIGGDGMDQDEFFERDEPLYVAEAISASQSSAYRAGYPILSFACVFPSVILSLDSVQVSLTLDRFSLTVSVNVSKSSSRKQTEPKEEVGGSSGGKSEATENSAGSEQKISPCSTKRVTKKNDLECSDVRLERNEPLSFTLNVLSIFCFAQDMISVLAVPQSLQLVPKTPCRCTIQTHLFQSSVRLRRRIARRVGERQAAESARGKSSRRARRPSAESDPFLSLRTKNTSHSLIMSNEEEPVKFTIKKRKGAPSGLRKKEPVGTPSSASTSAVSARDEPSTSEVVIAPKRQTTSHLIQGTGKKRRKTQEDADAGLDLSDSDEDEQRASYAVRHSVTSKRERRRSSSPPAWVSGEAIKAMGKDKNAPPEEIIDDGIYRGAQGEKHKLPKSFGPIKGGPANVRTITLTDYQPDVCKDYKGMSPLSSILPFALLY